MQCFGFMDQNFTVGKGRFGKKIEGHFEPERFIVHDVVKTIRVGIIMMV